MFRKVDSHDVLRSNVGSDFCYLSMTNCSKVIFLKRKQNLESHNNTLKKELKTSPIAVIGIVCLVNRKMRIY